MASRPLAAILTLGCKLNLADSEEIARGLRGAGFETIDRICEADAFVVNTCSVTHVSDAKSRGLIRSVRRLAPGAAVTVTGCFPQSAGFDAVRALGADLVVGTRNGDKAELVSFLAARIPGGEPLPPNAPHTFHTRAFIKAQEGCNDVCAFCIVPRTRGREESRAIDDVASEVERALEQGVREVVITGTQLGAWGRDLAPALKPHHLIAAVLERTDVPRLRFSSLQPQDITSELLALWSDPRLMPHFHLALQSGSEATLRAMRRRYTAAEFRAAADRIRAAVPNAAITTDVIAGFPGESDQAFEDTLALCRQVGFSRLHCFPYSQRANTTAARLAGQVPPDVRKARMAALLALGSELVHDFNASLEGTVRPVLWESRRTGSGGDHWFGHTDNYVPVYTPVTPHTIDKDLHNRLTPAYIGAVYDDGVRGYLATEVR